MAVPTISPVALVPAMPRPVAVSEIPTLVIVRSPAPRPVLSVMVNPSPETLARTLTLVALLIASIASSTVTARDRSISPTAPDRSVTRISPRLAPSPPFRSLSRVLESSLARPLSNVSVPEPTEVELISLKPLVSTCWLATSLSTVKP